MLCEIRGFHDRHQSSCNKNEQQDAKNNTELQTKWIKTSWKTFEEAIR